MLFSIYENIVPIIEQIWVPPAHHNEGGRMSNIWTTMSENMNIYLTGTL